MDASKFPYWIQQKPASVKPKSIRPERTVELNSRRLDRGEVELKVEKVVEEFKWEEA